MDPSHLDQPYASALSPSIPSIPSIPGTREVTAAKLAELLRKAGSLSASPEAVQNMIDLGAPADDIVKFTAWLEGKLNGTIQ